MKDINEISIEFLFVILAFALSLFLRRFFNGMLGERISYKMRQDIFSTFINFD